MTDLTPEQIDTAEDLTPEQLAELETKLATYYSQLPKGEIVAGLGLKEAHERLCKALINDAPQLIAMARRTAEAERMVANATLELELGEAAIAEIEVQLSEAKASAEEYRHRWDDAKRAWFGKDNVAAIERQLAAVTAERDEAREHRDQIACDLALLRAKLAAALALADRARLVWKTWAPKGDDQHWDRSRAALDAPPSDSVAIELAESETRRCSAETERDRALHLLGLAELPEERAEYAPDGYGAELDRVVDVLNEHDCGWDGTVSAAVRELLDGHSI